MGNLAPNFAKQVNMHSTNEELYHGHRKGWVSNLVYVRTGGSRLLGQMFALRQDTE